MWPDAVTSMQQHLLKAAVYTHPLVFGEIVKKCRETFLQTHRHGNPLNFDRWASVEQVMSKHNVIPIQVAHGIVADAVWSVIDCLCDFDTIGAVEFVQLVGVADKEIDRVPFAKNIWTLPRFTPANVGGSPHLNASLKPSFSM